MADMLITLNHNEALVLYNWISSLEQNPVSDLCDEAEHTVLWRIEGQIESALPDVVMSDYTKRVMAAKAGVVTDGG